MPKPSIPLEQINTSIRSNVNEQIEKMWREPETQEIIERVVKEVVEEQLEKIIQDAWSGLKRILKLGLGILGGTGYTYIILQF